MQNSKIEFLNSNHKDAKIETATPIPFWIKQYLWFYFSTVGLIFPKQAANYALKLFTTPRIRAKHAISDAILDSAEKKIKDVAGNAIMTYRWGNFEKTILLVHGWESRGTALRMFVKPFKALGFSVLTFDAPAHGDSSGEICTLPLNAFVVASLLKENNISGIVAHSFGCSCSIFALQFYANDYVKLKLAFMATPPKLHLILEDFMNSIPLSKQLKQLFVQKINAIDANIKDFDTALSENFVPVESLLLIQDATDEITPVSIAENIVNHWQKAHLLITEGYGHYRLAKNPDVVKRIVLELGA